MKAGVPLLAAVLLSGFAAQAIGQVGTISVVSPNTATQGTTGLTVTFTLTAPPPLPNPSDTPDSITIGLLAGTVPAWNGSQASAAFDIPADEAPGAKDCTVVFPPLGGNSQGPQWEAADGFTVTVGPDSPPFIVAQPQSQIVQPSDSAAFSVTAWGTEPMVYQWQKDTAGITGETNSSYGITAASDSDEGDYGCIVSNAFGVATSAVATLTVTDVLPCEGYNLFNPIQSTNTTLMDNHGTIVNTWSSPYRSGQSVYLLDNGSLLRTANTGSSVFTSGGAGGRIEQYDWDGNMTWAFDYDTASHRSHHDIEVLPNSNILMIAWEMKSGAEAIAAGRDPSLLTDGELWPDTVVEVAPTGTFGGEIVWEWHTWDHLVQDYSSTQANYAVVSNHPERIDLNRVAFSGADWTHINGVDYNEEFDQVILSVRNFSEIWIIDHSTTTEQAAGHTGGNSGKGGDLLYRWGNPQAYDRGDSGDQQLFVQHDAKWIEDGLPGAGNILVFNNGQGRPGGNHSSVDEIVLPVDAGGSYTGSVPYGPSAPAWSYTSTPVSNFYSSHIAGAQRLPNGSTLVCEGTEGYIFEVSTNSEIVWQYQADGEVFRFERYPYDFPGFDGLGLDPGEPPSWPYAIVDTGQEACYDTNVVIGAPGPGQPLAGQDAQYDGNRPSHIVSADRRTVYDYHTGLTWTQSPDLDDDGDIDAADKLTQAAAVAHAAVLNATNFGGYSDWRLPSIKEIYSLMDFRGTDPMSDDTSTLVPFIDTNHFAFGYGDTGAGERTIDAQFATTTIYEDTVMGGQQAMFGLNLADGRIKGYPTNKAFYVLCCRGNADYGINDFTDNSDGTVSDHASGLIWQQGDSGTGLIWSNALAYAEGLELAGYRDWRLPNAKELQSLLDYSRSPGTTASAAVDPVFLCTTITNEDGATDYPWYFSSTTHARQDGSGSTAAYVCFGRAMGYMNTQWMDVHGAGAQRSDSKVFDLTGYAYVTDGYYFTSSPQGDAARFYNYVRCVRGGATEPTTDTDGDGLTDWYEYDYVTNTTAMAAGGDIDGDGFLNISECGAGTSPIDSGSHLGIEELAWAASSNMVVTWQSVLGADYRLERSTNLMTDVFGTVVATGIEATPPINVYTDTTVSVDAAFYRVTAE